MLGSYIECLLYAFHRLARQCPDFLTADPAVLKDFRTWWKRERQRSRFQRRQRFTRSLEKLMY
nr:unnamed protein product [Callosobruchus chinensis]